MNRLHVLQLVDVVPQVDEFVGESWAGRVFGRGRRIHAPRKRQVDHPHGGHGDHANALSLAAAVALDGAACAPWVWFA